MALHDLPFGTISRILEAVARSQGRPFKPNFQAPSYHAVCPWHVGGRASNGKKDRVALQVDNVRNGWTCHYGCGKGGILMVLPRLAPELGIDRRSSLEWLVSNGLIPPAETPVWKTPEEQYEIHVARLCTRDDVAYPSTAAVRNMARRLHLPLARLEIEPWWEHSDPIRNASPERQAALTETLHFLGSKVDYFDDLDRLRDALQAEAHANAYAQVLLSDNVNGAHGPAFPMTLEHARGLARVARALSYAKLPPIAQHVEAHARALVADESLSAVSTWWNPNGDLPARSYHAYSYLLLRGAERFGEPWHAVEHRLEHDVASHERLREWLHHRLEARVAELA